MGGIIISDIETDDLDASVIHAVGNLNWITGEYRCYDGDDLCDGLLELQNADLIIGHWFSEYDAPTIERLTNRLIRFDYDKIVDTVKLSRMLVPELGSHKLETYGELFGFPKLEISDYSVWTPEFKVYLERDVRLTAKVWEFLWQLICE